MEPDTARQVFFVDDEPQVLAVVGKTLELQGIGVTCFESARACLSQLDERRCDLLITDVKMPEMDGIELVIDVKRRLPQLPILVVTGYGDVPMAVRALRAGAADFVEKPLDREAFLGAVERLLHQNAARMSLLNHSLTRMEARVLDLVLEGRNSREIATLLHRSARTIEVHRSHVMRKLGAANVVELLRRAADMGLLGPREAKPDEQEPTGEPA
ncbi:MAG: response regulator transcription factor [Sedimentisphaerales bacterium]|nr:response regulator transcription factor [Sedimentisphaerales bacterium]